MRWTKNSSVGWGQRGCCCERQCGPVVAVSSRSPCPYTPADPAPALRPDKRESEGSWAAEDT